MPEPTDASPDATRARLVVWAEELRSAHDRLRRALRVARESVDGDGSPARDLLLYCHGFCVALSAHHTGEDGRLFPELAERHPELRATLDKLEQDHSTMSHLITQFDHAVASSESAAVLTRHLDGISAIMESHFRFEERQLLGVLAKLHWDAPVTEVLGPL